MPKKRPPSPSQSSNTAPSTTKLPDSHIPLSGHVERVIRQYLIELEGNDPHDLYHMILSEVEKPLLSVILEHTNGNQTTMAKMLGVSRNTLRKKLAKHHLM